MKLKYNFINIILNDIFFLHLSIYIFILSVHNFNWGRRKYMVQIKVTPEMLEGVAKRAYGTRHALESIHKNLCDQIDHLCYQWTGASNQNFVQMFDDAKPKAFTFINGIANVEEELKQIAEKFRTADVSYDGKVSDDNIEEGATCGPLNSEKKDDKKDESLLDKFKHGVEDVYESAWDFLQGAGSAVAEDYIGLTPPDNDNLESKATYQAGRFTGHVLSTAGSIIEIFEGFSVVGGANFLTIVAEVGSGGLASPIVLPLDAVATAAGISAVAHGGYVWNKSIQNAQDTLQKIQSSGGGKGTVNQIPSYGKNSVPKGPYREVYGYPIKVKAGAQEKHIPNAPNYKQEVANGKNKSIFYGDNKKAQELLDEFAGKGQLLPDGKKERVDFGKPIGKYYDRDTGQYLETTRGMIHYGKDGAHIVPARP